MFVGLTKERAFWVAIVIAASLAMWLYSCGGVESSPDEALGRLFTMIKEDEFDRIYAQDARWTGEVLAIKQQPVFRQERELASHRVAAQEEYYAGRRYAELAEHALREPRIDYLERRSESGGAQLYYKLHFQSTDLSPRRDRQSFIRERVVQLTLDQAGRFVQFDIDSDYDVLWDAIPHRIEWVELRSLGGGDLSVEIVCTGRGHVEGIVQVGDLTASLVHMFHSEEMVWTARFDRHAHAEIQSGTQVEVTATARFEDGTKDGVRFDAIVPPTYDTVRAVDPAYGQSEFQIKAQQMKPQRADTIVTFIRLP